MHAKDLTEQTLEALDWEAVLSALASHARTPMGREALLKSLPQDSVSGVQALHDQIDEVWCLEELGAQIDVGGVADIRQDLIRAKTGEVLDASELRTLGHSVQALRVLARALTLREDDAPHLASIALGMEIDDTLADALTLAFDPSGQLSSQTYPQLGDLRQQVQHLHERIRTTLDSLVRGDELSDILQDRFVTLRNSRYVLPIKSHAKRWDIGIVHGTSGSGATAFIEPHQVIALNNQLRITEGELIAEERRILAQLSKAVGVCAPALTQAIASTTLIDCAIARAGLARQLHCSRPAVESSGSVLLRQARHPVLCLRGVAVVPNSLELNPTSPALLLTGPNAGGKTICLKTIGLCALLVRIGCFIPAAPGSRLDLFPIVYASIGDAQTVHDDLSSFSGHLVALRSMLQAAAPGALLLLDELASGTDPAQGGPLAQAVLEALLSKGAKLVVTTHYSRLKALPATDSRFSTAAMEYSEGKPTYRVLPNALGESRALATAARLGLDEAVVTRARQLMGEAELSLTAALEALELERQRADTHSRSAAEQAAVLEEKAAALAQKEAWLLERAEELKSQAAEEFVGRLAAAQESIRQVVSQLQRSPSHKGVDAARASLNALSKLVPTPPPAAQETPDETFAIGDKVTVKTLGKTGIITGISEGVVTIKSQQMRLKIPAGDLCRAKNKPPAPKAKASKKKRRKKGPRSAARRVSSIEQALRLPANTLDLRGMRVEEGFDAITAFMDQAVLESRDHVFLLHGHGTGALKQAIRRWLPASPYVHQWAPANGDQGGDAFTIVALNA